MKDEDKEWLLNTFSQYRGRTIRGEVLTAFYRAEMLLNGWTQIKKRSCSCQLRGMANEVDRLHDKWLQNEKTSNNE